MGQYQAQAHIVYEQNAWVQAVGYNTYPSADLLQLWVLLNRHFIRVATQLPADKLGALTNWGRDKPELVPLSLIIEDYVLHLDHHLKQLYQVA